jgi:hypothetical protein
VVEPGLLEVDDRGDFGSGAQDVGGAEVVVKKLRWQRVGWRVRGQSTQGVASRRGCMLDTGLEPIGDPLRQRCRGTSLHGNPIGVGVRRQRVLQPGQDRTGRSYLVGIGGVEEVALDLALEAHRDTVDLDLKTATPCRNGCRHRQPLAVQPTREPRHLHQTRETLEHHRPLREHPAGRRSNPGQRVAVTDHDPLAGVDPKTPMLVQGGGNPAAG